MAANESTSADRSTPARAAGAEFGDDFDAMSELDRADQSVPVDTDDDGDVFPEGPVGERFVDEADALDQQREAPQDDPDDRDPG